jgi:hypothetical protein
VNMVGDDSQIRHNTTIESASSPAVFSSPLYQNAVTIYQRVENQFRTFAMGNDTRSIRLV